MEANGAPAVPPCVITLLLPLGDLKRGQLVAGSVYYYLSGAEAMRGRSDLMLSQVRWFLTQ